MNSELEVAILEHDESMCDLHKDNVLDDFKNELLSFVDRKFAESDRKLAQTVEDIKNCFTQFTQSKLKINPDQSCSTDNELLFADRIDSNNDNILRDFFDISNRLSRSTITSPNVSTVNIHSRSTNKKSKYVVNSKRINIIRKGQFKCMYTNKLNKVVENYNNMLDNLAHNMSTLQELSAKVEDNIVLLMRQQDTRSVAKKQVNKEITDDLPNNLIDNSPLDNIGASSNVQDNLCTNKTGAIKKQFTNDKEHNNDNCTKVIEEAEELEVMVKSLAEVLHIKCDHENVTALCKSNNLIIQFRHKEELNKWKQSAREKLKREKFSYEELLLLEEKDVIPNLEEFTCPICLVTFGVGKGVTLRECVHSFCRECLTQTVKHSEELQIKCPYFDDDYSCPSVIQHRELKEVVPKNVYEKFLERNINSFGCTLNNAVFCKTPDCNNFYIIDADEDDMDLLMTFTCGKCKAVNCIPCKAIHRGLNCKQYQDKIQFESENDPEAAATWELFQKMLRDKVAIFCPKCKVIVMKTDGCDWIQCSMCKTEICWATFGPRWGPLGRGDTSGGCGCSINKKCHPNCKNCHY